MNDKNYPRLAKAGTAAARRDRWLRRLPIFVAALLGIPLLVLSIRFSIEVASITVMVVQLGGDSFGFLVLSVLGWVGLVCYLAFLFVATRRDAWRWRLVWSGAALLAAGALPLSWLILGWIPTPGA